MSDKDNALTEYLAKRFPEVQAKPFYRYIFPVGALDIKRKREEYKSGNYTGIINRMGQVVNAEGQTVKKCYRYTLTDELDAVDIATASDDFCICRPISYAGKSANAKNARWLYAFIVDLDYIYSFKEHPAAGLENLLTHIEKFKTIPNPTFIVSSGTGLHLYYVLAEPLPLFANIAKEAQKYKRGLTEKLWLGREITDLRGDKRVQYEGIYQGFRMVGTITKNGGRARAFFTGEKVGIDYLNSFMVGSYDRYRMFDAEAAQRQRKRDRANGEYRKKLSLAEAARLYPEWYERRIVQGQPRGAWAVNRRVYEWFRDRILVDGRVGHRYFCAMCLVIYAKKCGVYHAEKNPFPVSREELERDLYHVMDVFEGMTNTPDNHFGLDDIQSALEAYDDDFTTYPLDKITARTAIRIEKNKRNGRKQTEHLKIARFALALANESNGADLQGRKSKLAEVVEWRAANPEGRKCDCIRETGLSKPTVYKYWVEAETKTFEVDAHISGEWTHRTLFLNNGVGRVVVPEAERGKSGAEAVEAWEAESQRILAERGDAARAEWKAEQERQLSLKAERLENQNKGGGF